MIEQITKLPLDLTQSQPDNVIPNEQHPGEKTVIVARYGAFYKKSLSITRGGTRLIEGVDFDFAAYSKDATEVSGQAVYYAIVLYKASPTPVVMNYHAVGGVYCTYTGVIVDMINELNLVDDIVRASDIVGLPEVFPPGPHTTHGDDLIGLSRVVEMLARLVDAVITGNPAVLASLRTSLEDKLSANTPTRLNPVNGHATLVSAAGSATSHDLIIPRSEAQDTYVIVELLMLGDEGVHNALISYREVASGVSEVVHTRPGAANDSVAKFGIAKGNGNTTILRLANDVTVKPFKEVFIKSISSPASDIAYNTVGWADTPSAIPVTLRAL